MAWTPGSLPEDRPGCGFYNELFETEPALMGKYGCLQKVAGKDFL